MNLIASPVTRSPRVILPIFAAALLASPLSGCDADEPPDLAPSAIEAVEAAPPPAGPPSAPSRPPAPPIGAEASDDAPAVSLSAEQMAELRRSLREVELEAAERAKAAAAADAAEPADHGHGSACGCAEAREAAEPRAVDPRQHIVGPWRVMEMATQAANETIVPPPGTVAHFSQDSYMIVIPGREPVTVGYEVLRVSGSRLEASFTSVEGRVTVALQGASHARVTDERGRVLLVLAR